MRYTALLFHRKAPVLLLIAVIGAALTGCAGHRQHRMPEPVPAESDDYYAAAATRLENILPGLEQAFGPGDHRLIVPLATLSVVYFRQDRAAESDVLLERAWELIEAHPEFEVESMHLPVRYGSLPAAARAGDALDVRTHLAMGSDVNQRDAQGMTALHHAAVLGDENMAAALLAKGAIVTARDWERKTPRRRAEELGHDSIVEILARHVPASPPRPDAPAAEGRPDRSRRDDDSFPPRAVQDRDDRFRAPGTADDNLFKPSDDDDDLFPF